VFGKSILTSNQQRNSSKIDARRSGKQRNEIFFLKKKLVPVFSERFSLATIIHLRQPEKTEHVAIAVSL
jgi:hypothetical protein